MTDYLKNKKNVIAICALAVICWASVLSVMENKLLYAEPLTLNGSAGIITGTDFSSVVIIGDGKYWDGGSSSEKTFTKGSDYFVMGTFNSTALSTSGPLGGIVSSYGAMELDLYGQNITVENTYTSGGSSLQNVAAGFGYFSDTAFSGVIATTSSLGNFTATSASGAAYGMIFVNDNMNNSVNLTADARIEVGKLTATTGSTNDNAFGFQAFNVATEALVSIVEIETNHNGSGGSAAGVLLGKVGDDTGNEYAYVVGKINRIDQYTDPIIDGINIVNKVNTNTLASGFHATEIGKTGLVKLGTISVEATVNNTNSLYGVQINQVGSAGAPGSSSSNTVGQVAGTVSVGNIVLGSDQYRAKSAAGFLLRNGDSDKTAAGITADGQVTLADITIYSDSGYALGVSLGNYKPTNTNDADFGYAANDKLILNGDINVHSKNGDAVGIFAGQLGNIDVKHAVVAESTLGESYGILTTGKIESSATAYDKASVINIIDDDGVIAGKTKSISLGAVSGDTVNLNVNGWLNGNKAFTMDGVEIFNVNQTNDFAIYGDGLYSSTRGTATDPNAILKTNIASNATFTVIDSFFNGGKHLIEGGNLYIKNDTATIYGFIEDSIEFSGVNVELEAGAKLLFHTGSTYNLKITNGSTLTFNRKFTSIAGIGRSDWTSTDWTTKPINLSINGNSTLKFKGDLSNGDAAYYLHPFVTSVGQGGVTIEIDTDMVVEPGKIQPMIAAGNNLYITKTGGGELKLIDSFDLNTGGTIYIKDGTLSVNHEGTNYDPTPNNDEIIKNSPNLSVSGTSTFKLNGLDATFDILVSTSNTTLDIDAQRLHVNSGTISGEIVGLSSGQLVKNGTGYLTINGDNSGMAGALIQNKGTIELQSDLGDVTHLGHIDQNDGTFVFNGDGNGGTVKVFGDTTFKGEVDIRGKVIARSFKLENNAEVLFNLDPNKDWTDLIMVTNTPFDDPTREILLESADVSGLLYSRTGSFNNLNSTFSIKYETTTLQDYARGQGMTGNIGRVGNLFDNLMLKSSDLTNLIYDLDADELSEVLNGFLGSELAADALLLALSNPQHRVFNHLRSLDRPPHGVILGQAGFRVLPLNYDLWAEGGYRSEKVKGDGEAYGYDIERGGMIVGVDAKVGDRIVSGLMFGYGNPHVSNRIGKVAVDDISFGIFSRFRLFYECSINVFLGYGVQNYKYNHSGFTTDYNGDALYAGIELFRPIQMYAHGQLIPLVAIDFQKAWSDAFVEGDLSDPNFFDLRVGKSNIDQTVLRIGLNSKLMPTPQIQVRTRFQYGLQVAGDLYASANTSFLVNPTISQNLRSVQRGRNNLNIGFGTDLYTASDATKFFLDYDYNYNKYSNAHSFQIGLVSTR